MASMLAKGVPDTRRMVQQHQQMKHELHGNFVAPLAEPQAILDVGCNNGRWAMEMAMQFPAARVIGIDVVAPTPFLNLGSGIEQPPPNATFEQLHAWTSLPYPDATFDFVHMRFVYTNVPAQAWDTLVRELARILRPGGWLECVEPLPFGVAAKTGLSMLLGWFGEWLRQQERDPNIALKMTVLLKTVGLAQVNTFQLGNYADDAPNDAERTVWRANSLLFIDLLSGPLVAAGVVSADEFERVATTARTELGRGQVSSSFKTYVTVGQRTG
jgi:SAM-dependent methyltransferase